MRDELWYLGASSALNLVVLMGFRIPDERFAVLLLIFPMFIALIIGIPLWLYLTAEFGMPMGMGALVLPLILIFPCERLLSPRRRIGLSWAVLVFGVACARLALHAPSWL
ncbi:MAG: hypothetical protein J0H14_24025 [Alphaproteobacteria bacterium]|nr:hypothetical protein [Alphaproteobacteria bacterium]